MEIEKIKGKLNNQDKNMEIVFQYLDEPLKKKHLANPFRTRIGFMPDTMQFFLHQSTNWIIPY